MLLYEYRCARCNHQFEVYHEVGGTSGPCPVCGGPARRIFTSVGLIFKGSGFYTTDYRKPSSSDGEAKKAPAGPASPDAAAKSTSSKPAS